MREKKVSWEGNKLMLEETRIFKAMKNISLSDIARYLTIMPFALIVGAYIYTSQYFGNFGIDVDEYFTITDYLSISVNIIAGALLATALAIIYLFVILLYTIFTMKIQKKIDRMIGGKINNSFKNRKIRKIVRILFDIEPMIDPKYARIFFIVLFFMFLTSAGIHTFFAPFPDTFTETTDISHSFDVVVWFPPLIIFILVIVPMCVKKISQIFLITSFTIFYSIIFLVTSLEINSVYESLDTSHCLDIAFHESVDEISNECDYVVLGANSQFLFLTSKSDYVTVAIQRHLILSSNERFG